MYHPQKNFSRFVVFVFDVFFDNFTQGFITRFVTLHNIAHALVDHNNMVILVKDLEVFFVGNYFIGQF
jgi:hypothetical protein